MYDHLGCACVVFPDGDDGDGGMLQALLGDDEEGAEDAGAGAADGLAAHAALDGLDDDLDEGEQSWRMCWAVFET